MKKPVALASLAATLLAAPLSAEKLVREISVSALKAGGGLQGGEVVPPAPGLPYETIRVVNPEGVPRTVPLFTIDRPGVKAPRYVLRGEVSGEGVEGQAYLEMWNFFPGGGRYFSRTLAPAGPMASLGGTFRARPFMLPFTTEPGMSPERLTVSVALPGRGAVSLGRLRLMELDSSDDFYTPAGSWLTGRQIALFGGIGGSVLGLLGALVGVLASRRRARGLVLALLQGMLAFGAVALLAALAGWWRGQPRELLSALLVLGSLCTLLPAVLLAKVRRQYEEKEFRRMRALDAR